MQENFSPETVTKHGQFGSRTHLMTHEFADLTHHASQTVRKNYCQHGSCFGIRPIKVGNRLLWPIDKVMALLHGASK